MFVKRFAKLIFIFIFLISFSPSNALKKKETNDQKINPETKIDFNSQELFIKLDEIKNILIKNNQELSIIKSQIEQSKNILKSKIAFWSPKIQINSNELPKLTTGETRNKLRGNTASNQLKAGINASFEWDIVNPSRKLEIKIAREKIENLELIYKSTINDLFLKTIEIYYSIIASNQEIKVANQAINISLISLKESENKFIAGVGNKLDVLEAKAQLNRNKINLLNRINQLNRNKNSLSEILNINRKISIDYNEKIQIFKIWNNTEKETIKAAFKNRLDLKIKKKNININTNEALSILSNKKPNLTFYNTYSISSASGETGIESPDYNNLIKNNSNNVGIKFNWNLFDGGNVKQNYLSLKNKNEELDFEFSLKKNQINKEIKNEINNYKTSIEKIILSLNQLNAAKESLKISLKRLEAGITTQREIVNMQGDLLEAETNFINSIKEYKINLATLSRMTLIEDDLICTKKGKGLNKINFQFVEFLEKNNLTPKCKV